MFSAATFLWWQNGEEEESIRRMIRDIYMGAAENSQRRLSRTEIPQWLGQGIVTWMETKWKAHKEWTVINETGLGERAGELRLLKAWRASLS